MTYTLYYHTCEIQLFTLWIGSLEECLDYARKSCQWDEWRTTIDFYLQDAEYNNFYLNESFRLIPCNP